MRQGLQVFRTVKQAVWPETSSMRPICCLVERPISFAFSRLIVLSWLDGFWVWSRPFVSRTWAHKVTCACAILQRSRLRWRTNAITA